MAPEIAAYGFDVWHVGFCIDMIAASKTIPNRKTVLLGNIIPIDELVKPKPETVKEICNKMMDRFEEDPRFVLSTGGFISYGTPIENVKAMMYAADARSRK